MTGNLLGEQFDQYVFDQIKVRQELSAAGFGSSLKTPTDIQVLNNQNSFIKLASGVDLFQTRIPPPDKPTLVNYQQLERDGIFDNNDIFYMSGLAPVVDTAAKKKYQEYREQVIKNNKNQNNAAQLKLKNLGFTESDIKSLGHGSKLAQNSILFGGLGSLDTSDNFFPSISKRVGISNSNNIWNYNAAYGLGGNQFGKQPMPGVTSARVDCINNGSIRTATIQIKAYNTFQFQLIEMLYLRLGFTMMLEWGHNKFLNGSGGIESMQSTLIEKIWFSQASISQLRMLELIEEERDLFSANYDGFFGRVTNFSWKFTPEGTYDITLKLATLGDIIESLQINIPSPIKRYSKTDSSVVNTPNTLQTWLDDFIKNDIRKGDVFQNGNFINLASLNYKKSSSLNIIQQQAAIASGDLDVGDNFTFKLDIGDGNTKSITGSFQTLKQYIYDNGVGDKAKKEEEVKKLRSVAFGNLGVTSGLTKENSYFVTFGELLNKIYNNILPRVYNDGGESLPILGMGLSEKLNVVSAQPNQMSFDLNICFVKPLLYAVGIETPPTLTNDRIKDFFKLEKEGDSDIFYGQLMNVYLNFEFIKKQLQKSNKGGSLSLYKFLEGICDGINSALGDVNKIEPIINNESNEIVFIDQNPIRGNPTILKKLLDKAPSPIEITPIEIFGLNTTNPTQPQSNFVKSFSFDTKIDSKLASMITIGTTAGQGTSKIIDGTIFSSWNAGLEDRFQKNILPAPGFLSEKEIEDQIEKESDEKITEEFNTYWGDVKKKLSLGNWSAKSEKAGYYNTGENTNGNTLKWARQRHKNDQGGISGKPTKYVTFYNFKTGKYKGFSFTNRSRTSALNLYLKWKKTTGKDVVVVPDLDLKTSYQSWLCYALGGKIIGKKNTEGEDFVIPPSEALYLNISNKQFFQQGKIAFKEYIKLRDQKIFRITGNPSNQQGFIPVSLSLVLDGISGVKIYNKLNINQKFLPQEYQSNLITSTLDFVISKINHEIKDEKWQTTLSTISIPPSGPESTELIDDGLFNYLNLDENNITSEDRTVTSDINRIPVSQLSPNNFIKEELKKSEGYYSGGENRVFRSKNIAYAYPDPKPPSKIALIKSESNYFQGLENLPWTIGYGQTYYAKDQVYTRNGIEYIGKGTKALSPVEEGDSITKSSAEVGFERVLDGIAKQMVANNRIRVPLTQNEYNALLSFSYNSGPGVSKPKKPLYDLINSQDYTSAGYKLQQTLTNNGQLTSRRMKEADIWFTNNPGNPS